MKLKKVFPFFHKERKKYLHHKYHIDGEDLPTDKKTINKKALCLSIVVMVFPFLLLNFFAGTYITIVEDLAVTMEQNVTIFDVFGADWGKSISIKNAFIPVFSFSTYSFFGVIFILIGFLAYSKFNYKSEQNVAFGQKGDSKFRTMQEIKRQFPAIPDKTESFEGYGGLPVSHYKDKYYIDVNTTNTIILGVSRSGKGEMLVVPMIDNLSRAKNQSSLVVNDPKGELYCASKETLEKRGYDVQVLNILEPAQSMSYNPLQLVIDAWVNGDTQEAAKRANTLTFSLYNNPNAGENAYFYTTAQRAVNGIILALIDYCVKNNCVEKVTMNNVSQMLNELGTFYFKDDPQDFIEKNALDEYFKSLPQGNVAKMQYGSANFAGDKSKGSIFSTANEGLQIFNDENFAKMTSKSSIDLKQVGFPKNLFFQLDESFLNKRVTVSFHKNNAEKTEIASYKLKVKAYGMCNMNFNETLEDGDLLLIRYQDDKKQFRAFYELKFEKLKDEKENVIYSKKVGHEHEPEYKKDVTLKMKANNFPTKPRAKLTYSDKPSAVFMVVPDYDKSNHVLASIFIKQLYTELSMNCNDTRGKKCFRRIHFMLDEAGNMPAVEDMSGILTVCAGRNMLFNLVLQSYAQLDELYDKQAKAIKQNCQNHVYIMSTDEDTIEEISKRAGTETIIGKSSNEGHFEIDNKLTKSADEQRIMRPDRLRQFIEGEMLVLAALHRQDKERKKIRPSAIFCTKETSMPYRYQFLSNDFDTTNDLNDIDIASEHTNLELSSLYIDFADFLVDAAAKAEHERRQKVNVQKVVEELTVEKVIKTLVTYVQQKKTASDSKEIQQRLVKILLDFMKNGILPQAAEVENIMIEVTDKETKIQLKKLLQLL